MNALHFILFLIAGVLIAESEKIYRKIYKLGGHTSVWFSSKWYLSNNWSYTNPIINFIMKYFLAPFKDGFHFVKTLGILLFCLSVSDFDIVYCSLLFVTFSLGFIIRYHIENGKWS